jgi:hypothetical protein
MPAVVENSRKPSTRRKVPEYHRTVEAAIPDIHANPSTLSLIQARLPKVGRKIFLGDAANKGPQSIATLKLLRKHFRPETWTLLWGNHDLLLVLAAFGSRKAQKALLLHRDGEKLLREIGDTQLADSVALLDLKCKPQTANHQRRFARALLKEKELLNAFDTALTLNKELQEIAQWMIHHFKIAYVSPSKVLYMHAGVPVLKGRPRYSVDKLNAMSDKLEGILAARKLDHPLLKLLDGTVRSPLRVKRWLAQIKDPQAFCDELGVYAIVVGHSVFRISYIKGEPFPILRHDFREPHTEKNIPSYLIVDKDEFKSFVYVNGKWRRYLRKP